MLFETKHINANNTINIGFPACFESIEIFTDFLIPLSCEIVLFCSDSVALMFISNVLSLGS